MPNVGQCCLLDVATPQATKTTLGGNQWLLGLDVHNESVANGVDTHHKAHGKFVDDLSRPLEVRHVKIRRKLDAERFLSERTVRGNGTKDLFQLLKVVRYHRFARNVGTRNVELDCGNSLCEMQQRELRQDFSGADARRWIAL